MITDLILLAQEAASHAAAAAPAASNTALGLAGIGAGIGVGLVGLGATQSVGRNPEARQHSRYRPSYGWPSPGFIAIYAIIFGKL